MAIVASAIGTLDTMNKSMHFTGPAEMRVFKSLLNHFEAFPAHEALMAVVKVITRTLPLVSLALMAQSV